MIKRKKIILFITYIASIIFGITIDCWALPAFPGAEGGGAATVGGRGGRIVEVTNLDSDGPGSFKSACEVSGPRNVVFRVNGIIDLDGKYIYIQNPYITIAGQTAPGGGILLKNGSLHIKTHDVIMRFIRIRLGSGVADDDSLSVFDGSYNLIIDHCSFSWATDENIGVWSNHNSAHNLTFSWNIIAEDLSYYGALNGSDIDRENMVDISYHHNLFMHNSQRNPKMDIKRSRVINNIIYDYDYSGLNFTGGIDIDIIGNKFKTGANSNHPANMIEYWRQQGVAGAPTIYITNNLGPDFTSSGSNNWEMIHNLNDIDRDVSERSTPLPSLNYPITITDVTKLDDILLPDVGASRRINKQGNWETNRDSVDQRLIQEYKTGAGRYITHENEVGGYPTITPGTPYQDTDRDGMPDDWETHYELNPNDPTDGNEDASGNGYTNFEDYVNGMEKTGGKKNTKFLIPLTTLLLSR